jgi:hypothetical protein
VKITTVIRKLNAVARDLVDYTHLEGKTKKNNLAPGLSGLKGNLVVMDGEIR